MEYTLYFRHMICAFLVGTTGPEEDWLACNLSNFTR